LLRNIDATLPIFAQAEGGKTPDGVLRRYVQIRIRDLKHFILCGYLLHLEAKQCHGGIKWLSLCKKKKRH
jgi:hypothetical protein